MSVVTESVQAKNGKWYMVINLKNKQGKRKLKWSSVDFENMTLTIRETLQQGIGGNYVDTPKTDSSYRTMPLTQDVAKMLKVKK